ncbi:MAG: ATP synthase F1 subunit epsilon [Oscillospiraceae bacterium]
MSTFKLKVVTPDREIYNDEVRQIIVRTSSGDVGILSGHSDYIAPLATGALKVFLPENKQRIAAISNGMIRVTKECTTILTNTCEWSDEIDIERAKAAEQRARKYLESPTKYHSEEIARLKLNRALNRINLGNIGQDK